MRQKVSKNIFFKNDVPFNQRNGLHGNQFCETQVFCRVSDLNDQN